VQGVRRSPSRVTGHQRREVCRL